MEKEFGYLLAYTQVLPGFIEKYEWLGVLRPNHLKLHFYFESQFWACGFGKILPKHVV